MLKPTLTARKRGFLLLGLHLDEAKREEVKHLRTKISDLGAIFSSNLNEENTVLEFTRDELEGVPEDLVNSFEKVMKTSYLKVMIDFHKLFYSRPKTANAKWRLR